MCDHDVLSQNECENAAESIHTKDGVVNGVFRVASGTGYDLPQGCIMDSSTPNVSFVYWNPKGVAISNDSNVQPICRDKLKGIYQISTSISDFHLCYDWD